VPKESHAEVMSQPPSYDPNEILPVRILEVSKTTNAEANPIFYSGNCFTTAANSDMGWDHIHHMFLQSFYPQGQESKGTIPSEHADATTTLSSNTPGSRQRCWEDIWSRYSLPAGLAFPHLGQR